MLEDRSRNLFAARKRGRATSSATDDEAPEAKKNDTEENGNDNSTAVSTRPRRATRK